MWLQIRIKQFEEGDVPGFVAGGAQMIDEAVDDVGIAVFEDFTADNLARAALRQVFEPLDHHRRDADTVSTGEPIGEDVRGRHEGRAIQADTLLVLQHPEDDFAQVPSNEDTAPTVRRDQLIGMPGPLLQLEVFEEQLDQGKNDGDVASRQRLDL